MLTLADRHWYGTCGVVQDFREAIRWYSLCVGVGEDAVGPLSIDVQVRRYLHACVYICMYVYVCIPFYACVWKSSQHRCTSKEISACVCIYACMCMYAYPYLCMYSLCVCVGEDAVGPLSIDVQVSRYVHACVYICMYVYVCIPMLP